MKAIIQAIVGSSIGLGVLAAGTLAFDIVKLPIVRDYEIIEQSTFSNWDRNEMMFVAEDKCKIMRTLGGGMSARAASYHLQNKTPTEMAKGMGLAFLATKHACPEYRQFFEQDFADIVTSINGWDAKEVAQVLGVTRSQPGEEIY